jgi:hypothetical protein
MLVSTRQFTASCRTRSLAGIVLVALWVLGGAAPAEAGPKRTYFTDLPSVTGNSVCDGNDVGVTGLYQDGLGTYSGSELLHPACAARRSPGRAVNLLLPAGTLDDPIATCGPIWLAIPDLLDAQAGDILGLPAPPDTSTGDTVFLYFLTDSNGDGKFSSPGDDQYNVRWQAGIYVQSRTVTPTGTVFELSTKDVSRPDLSGAAELIHRNSPSGEISLGSFCIPLELTVRVSP